jgi:outer membrane biosynthesis protein TonB
MSDDPRPSIPSRIPVHSSGTPYVIASGVLVVIIAGVLWFKFRKTEAPPPPPPVIMSAPTSTITMPAFDLPPPPPEEVEAGPAEADSGPKRVAGPANANCASPCQGTDSAALSSALRGAAGSARGCYERALRTNSMLQGRIKVGVRVGANGSICSASLLEDSLHSAEVTSCVLGLFRGKPFPAPSGGSCVDVTIPVSFTPQEGKK